MQQSTLEAPSSAGMAGYRRLAEEVRRAGLLQRRLGREVPRIALTGAAFAGGWVLAVALGGSWWSLGAAAYLGAMSAQVVFLGHDAGHRQIFGSRLGNRIVGLAAGNLLTGLSFGWWVPKHAAHHGHPNQVGRDPDIAPGVIAFTPEDPSGQRTGRRAFVRAQAVLFFPLMALQVVGMRRSSIRSVRERADRRALLEAALIALHVGAYLALVLAVMPPLQALAFIAVQHAVFGIYLGCSFAPNHVGMPVLDEGAATSFAYRQVRTSRDVRGGRVVTFLLGGLDLQIEHHLFPTMPRSNLRRAQPLVQAYCASEGWAYRHVSLPTSYGQVLRSLWVAGRGRRAILSPA